MKRYPILATTTVAIVLCAPAVAQEVRPYTDRQQRAEAVAPQADIPGATGMVFTAMEPCRLLDTRVASARSGRLAANSARDFLVFDADLAAEQGGRPWGCDVPDTARAVAINLTAVDASGRGFVTAWDYGSPRPATANINLIPGEDVNNQLSVAVNSDSEEPDLMVYSFASTHLVADIVGYYTQPAARALECISLLSDPEPIAAGASHALNSPSCPADYARTGGSCISFDFEIHLVTSEGYGNYHYCAARSNAPYTSQIQAGVDCCRVPGN